MTGYIITELNIYCPFLWGYKEHIPLVKELHPFRPKDGSLITDLAQTGDLIRCPGIQRPQNTSRSKQPAGEHIRSLLNRIISPARLPVHQLILPHVPQQDMPQFMGTGKPLPLNATVL